MPTESLAVFIPIVALSIPLAGIIFHGLQKVARLRLEEARVRAGALGPSAAEEVASLREEVGEVRRELAEVQERLDFTERLLTQARDGERLPGQRS